MAKKKINSFLLSSNSDVRSYYQYLYFRVQVLLKVLVLHLVILIH